MTLFVDACLRDQSRTRRLAHAVLPYIPGNTETLMLADAPVRFLDEQRLAFRMNAQDFSDPRFDFARQFVRADTLVIAAPYYDLSFPAILRAWFEQIQVGGLTFVYGDDDRPHTLSRLKRVVYVSTAGGPVIGEHLGYRYVCEVCRYFYGVRDFSLICAQGLDLKGADAEAILHKVTGDIPRLLNTHKNDRHDTAADD